MLATWIACIRHLDVAGIVRCTVDFQSPSCMKVNLDAAQVAATIRGMTREDEFIFVGNLRHDRIYVNDALMYFLIQRPIAVKWNEMHPGVITTETVQHQIIAALEKRQVRIAVLADMPQSQEPNESSQSSGVELLDIYLAQNFRTMQQVGRYRIVERIL